jgi:hypothetical protein
VTLWLVRFTVTYNNQVFDLLKIMVLYIKNLLGIWFYCNHDDQLWYPYWHPEGGLVPRLIPGLARAWGLVPWFLITGQHGFK